MRLVSKFRRKNLVVDGEKIELLARLKGTSASEAVRDAVDHALVAEEIGAAIRELHALGGIDDVFHKFLDEESEPSASASP